MAPKKRSQTPRHQGVADSHHQQQVQTHFTPSTQPQPPVQLDSHSTPTTTDRRRKQKDDSDHTTVVASTRSPTIPDSPLSPVDGVASGSHSRRESTSTMRTSSISLEGHPTCTPTGRISKAKKGKRVHACEFPGCGKVRIPSRQPPILGLPFGPKRRHLANTIIRSSRELNTEGKHYHRPLRNGPFHPTPLTTPIGDMSSIIILKHCFLAHVLGVERHSTVSIFCNVIRSDSKSSGPRTRRGPC